MNVISVVWPLQLPGILKVIKHLTLVRNPTNVICVTRTLQTTVLFKCMKACILEKNPMNEISVVRLLHSTVIFKGKKNKKKYEWNQYNKAFSFLIHLQMHKSMYTGEKP